MTKTPIPTNDARHGADVLRLARAARLSCCPLCAEPRKATTFNGAPALVCPRCGDLACTSVNLALAAAKHR